LPGALILRIVAVPLVALLLCVGAITSTTLLLQRSNEARGAQLSLAKVEKELSLLQTAPFQAHTSTGGSPAVASRAIATGKRHVSDTLERLGDGSAPAALGRVRGPLRANYAAIDQIYTLGVTHGYGPRADRLGAVAGRANAQITGLLDSAAREYHSRAARSHAQALGGAAGAIVLLLGAFAYFFRRSQRLSARNAKLLAESRNEALTDSLTGLGNRRALTLDLASGIEQVDGDGELLLALFDLDGFKQYNDTFGHPAGDALLTRIGTRLTATLDGMGVAYRMGGDEFCLLALASPGSSALIESAAAALSESGHAFEIGCSFGSVVVPTEAATAEQAFAIADQRLYSTKRTDASASRQTTDVLLQVITEQGDGLADHVDVVARLAATTARSLGLPDAEVSRISRAGELHDVGKSAIPDAVLNKPGALDKADWELMRNHTLIGERIVLAAPSLADTADLVRSSHERVDGSGYPDGLAGEGIPIGARIIAVCDAYAAMTSDRPYRAAMPVTTALEELQRCASTQFDPKIVRELCAIVREPERTAAA